MVNVESNINSFCDMCESIMEDKGYVFDFDDTLAKTPAKIHIIKNNSKIKSLSPAIYNTYKLKDGESFDFSDFEDPNIIRMAKKFKIWKVLKNVENALNTGRTDSKMYILTARSSNARDSIHEFLISNGIRSVKKSDIFTVGDTPDEENPDPRPIADRKKEILFKLRKKHEGDVVFFDDDQKNIDVALEVPGIKTRLVKEEFETESILDEPRKNMNPAIWDLQSAGATLKSGVHDNVLDGLIDLVGDVPIDDVYIVGSLTGTRYNKDADLDVSVIIDADDETLKHVRKRAGQVNGKFVPGTTNPINYFVMNKNPGLDRFDSAYDFKDDKWVKDPKDHGVNLFSVYDEFRQFVKDIDLEKDEALRSLIDIDILMSAIETGGDSKIIFDKILSRFKALNYSIKNLAEKYDDVHKERVDAFLKYEGGDKKGLPSPNLLPENIRYKLLERYHYLDFMHKLLKLVDVTGDIDTAEDLEAVRNILSEEAKETCEEFRKGGMRNHDKNVDPKNEGKTFFEKSLKRWNDKATGKTKDYPTVKSDRKSNITEERLTEASFGTDNYKVPKNDKEQMMMDFYFLSGVYTLIPDKIPGVNTDELKKNVEFLLGKIASFVQQDLSEATFFSICAETRHWATQNTVSDITNLIKKDPSGQEVVHIRTVKTDAPDFKLKIPYNVSDTKKYVGMFEKYVVTYDGLDNHRIGPSRERLEKYGNTEVAEGTNRGYKNSWKAAKVASKGDDVAFAELSKFLFLKADWNSSYGGDPWAGIAHFFIEVHQAVSIEDKIATIDKLFSLQHNTGTVLNKVQKYSKDGFGWITRALDFKFDVRNFWDYKDKVSPGLKRLVGVTSKIVQKQSEGEKKSGDDSGSSKKTPVKGDYVKHKDLGYLGAMKITRTLKTVDDKHGQLFQLRNPETGKTLNAFEDKITVLSPKAIKIEKSGDIDTKLDGIESGKTYVFNGKSFGDFNQIDSIYPTDAEPIKYKDLKGVKVLTSTNTTGQYSLNFKYDGEHKIAHGFDADTLIKILENVKDDSTDDSVKKDDESTSSIDSIDDITFGQEYVFISDDSGSVAFMNDGEEIRYSELKGSKVIPQKDSGTGTITLLFKHDGETKASTGWNPDSLSKKIGETNTTSDLGDPVDVKDIKEGESFVFNGKSYSYDFMNARVNDSGKVKHISYSDLKGIDLEIKEMSPKSTHIDRIIFTYNGVEYRASGFSTKKFSSVINYPIDDSKSGDTETKGLTGDAQQLDNAKIEDNAHVFDEATVYEDCTISDNAKIFGDAQVYEDAQVFGNAEVSDDAQVFGNAMVHGESQVYGEAQIYEDAEVYGYAIVHGDTEVFGDAKINKGEVRKGSYASVAQCEAAGLYDKNIRTDDSTPTKKSLDVTTISDALDKAKEYVTYHDEKRPDSGFGKLAKILKKFGSKTISGLTDEQRSDMVDQMNSEMDIIPSHKKTATLHEAIFAAKKYIESAPIEDVQRILEIYDVKKISELSASEKAKFIDILNDKMTESIDYDELKSVESLDEYTLALEGIMSKVEATGGKLKKIKSASEKNKRVIRGSKGALGSKQMSLREQMRRKKGGEKSNMKTKVRGKLALANKKKIIGQKMNPNNRG